MLKCHDCSCDLPDGGHDYKVEDRAFHKCHSCFKKNPLLTNYQDCEVFTRVVGYLRPQSQMHTGKLAEVKQRKMFKVDGIV